MLTWNGEKVLRAIDDQAKKNLRAATIYLKGKVQEALSIAAPRKRVMIGGMIVYLATAKAAVGAPPRKLSGTLRQRITWEQSYDGMTTRVGTNLPYGYWQEKGFTIRAGRWIPIPTDQEYTVKLFNNRKAKLNRVRWIRLKHDVRVHHPFLAPTLNREKSTLARMLGTFGTMGTSRVG